MKLCDVFTRNVVTAWPEESLRSVAHKMQEHNVGSVVIVVEHRPVGIVTDRDLALKMGAEGLSPDTPVENVMSDHVLAVPEDTGIFTATKYMRESGVRRLPIVDRDDRLVGIVSMDDLLHCLGRELFNLSEGIRQEMRLH